MYKNGLILLIVGIIGSIISYNWFKDYKKSDFSYKVEMILLLISSITAIIFAIYLFLK